jgi:hypothetical protein
MLNHDPEFNFGTDETFRLVEIGTPWNDIEFECSSKKNFAFGRVFVKSAGLYSFTPPVRINIRQIQKPVRDVAIRKQFQPFILHGW